MIATCLDKIIVQVMADLLLIQLDEVLEICHAVIDVVVAGEGEYRCQTAYVPKTSLLENIKPEHAKQKTSSDIYIFEYSSAGFL